MILYVFLFSFTLEFIVMRTPYGLEYFMEDAKGQELIDILGSYNFVFVVEFEKKELLNVVVLQKRGIIVKD